MGSRGERDKTKQLQDKCQAVLNDLLRDDDNKYCVDCDSKGPRWASWNIGVFLCIRCAGIHRNLGVHISKVKSVNLDTWTPEQVGMLQEIGNSRARAVYEANLPDNFRRPQNDSSLESFIRAKYEHKKYIASEWVPPTLPKVNWDKEIDEEMEKQKRKKKAHVEKKSLVTVEVPQIPKPKVPSPKPNRIVSTPEAKKKDGDLLGLQNGDDSFSGFLSASTTTKPEDDVKADSIKSEEESFFNQTIPTEKEKVKLTKDSILALYGSAPPINQLPYQQSSFGAQAFGNNFPQQPQQVQQNFAAPLQNNGAPGQFAGSMQWPNQWANKPQPQFANQFAANQFQGNQLFQNGQFPPIGQTQNGQAKQPGFQQQFASFPQAPQSTSTPPNPFFANQNNLQQQFGNLGLTNQASNATLPTLSTNIWQ